MLDKTKVSPMVKILILFFMAPRYPFYAYFERYMLSLKICAKKGRGICQKCQGTQIKAFLSFGIKEGNTNRGCSLYSPFNSKHKNAFIWVPWHFWHMRNKTKESCIFFMTPQTRNIANIHQGRKSQFSSDSRQFCDRSPLPFFIPL